MTTTQSPTTAARQTRNATGYRPYPYIVGKTTEKWQQRSQEVTDKADPLVQQLPTVDLTKGVERYFEFVQKAVDINRELATNWADAVNSLSGVLREQTEKTDQLVTDQTEKARDLITEQADKVESATREQTDKVESATREQADKVEQTEKTLARQDHQATHGHTDEHHERLIDTK